ncbi:hypothetical protein HYW20_07800 [Candidatus Woesearchaeota archaeon]|nr:hypothetical protein [Candidatus Woesearchaeota archaeon]
MKIIIFLLFALSIMAVSANAISVVSDYLVDDTLVLIQGESKIYSIRLQNPTDNEVGIKLDYDRKLMKAVDYKEVYILPPKTAGYRVLFNVTAPEETGLYDVSYTVGEVEPSGGGSLPILLKINRNFKLKVVENPKKFKLGYGSIIFATAILAFVLHIFIKKTEIKQKPGGKLKLKQKNN